MAHHALTFEAACAACKATGLYVGMAERDGAAVVCSACKGTGQRTLVVEYDDFEGRKARTGITRVFEANPGIGIGQGHTKAGQEFQLEDFGGQSYADWWGGQPFPSGSEMRQFTCPAWWYQTADYARKPKWDECCFGTFSHCRHFVAKDQCWQRWDRENAALALGRS